MVITVCSMFHMWVRDYFIPEDLHSSESVKPINVANLWVNQRLMRTPSLAAQDVNPITYAPDIIFLGFVPGYVQVTRPGRVLSLAVAQSTAIDHTQHEKQQPNFAWRSNRMREIFYRVYHAPCPGRDFGNTNADARSVCGSKRSCFILIL